MTQHLLTISNDTRTNVRTNIQDALKAVGSNQKGNNAPGTPQAGWFWLDDNTPSSSNWTLSLYDGTDWIALGYVNTSSNIFTLANAVPLAGSGGVTGAYYYTGVVMWGQNTTTTPGSSNTTLGAVISDDGSAHFSNNGAYVNLVNRNSDGILWVASRSGTAVGSISVTSTATIYATSSDHRLKIERGEISAEEAFAAMTAARPIWFNWTNDPAGPWVDGFLAHEMAEILPHAVVGQKDAVRTVSTRTVVGDDGEPRVEQIEPYEEIVPQGVDQSKWTPLVVAACRGLIVRAQAAEARADAAEARADALEARLAALEARFADRAGGP